MVKSASEDLRALGQRVRQLRETAGLSKVDLQQTSGVHRMTITHLEAGDLDVQVATLFRLAEALTIDVAEFFSAGGVGPTS